MATIVKLAAAGRNERLIGFLRETLQQSEAGEIVGMAGIKLRPDNAFASFRVGDCSDLELAGALSFAQFDLMTGNKFTKE